MVASEKADAIRQSEKLRMGGERGRAITAALEAELTPEEVPFIEGYTEHYVAAGLPKDEPPAKKRGKSDE